ncbi:flavin reductase family protein [Actinoplanes sp. NEAU-A12]|uniref:Flavin reductase family protein n=1 Tax=Actinoplanes sandaracinus TaxID=3045177 RepID=A0ABT6WYL7_9ACTN|nr:flavin reductase family protein [Actinoplanes sandaracinus]MDI6104834.1 flavin reductase family protein [Actinoplanes sandaracinus]
MTVVSGRPVDAADVLRRAMRRHPAGVTVVTVPGPAGFTATSFVSVSLRPALVAFFLDESASVAGAVRRASHFGVHLLHQGHTEVAQRFARSGADRFAGRAWHAGPADVPLLDGIDHLVARTVSVWPVGDHLQVVGEVVGASTYRPAAPLVYHDGGYATAAPSGQPAA